MATKKAARPDKRSVAEQLWLHYFNQYLFNCGIISETTRNRMTARINCRGSSPPAGESN